MTADLPPTDAPATVPATEGAVWRRRALWFIALLTLGRVLYLAVLPLDLSADESYYWDWSRRLDWCYYSKPPMIAWINWLSSAILGPSTFSVRLPAALFSGAGCVALYLLTARLYGERAAFWAVLLGQATVASLALGMIMTIDAPLSCAWTWCLYATWRALDRPSGDAEAEAGSGGRACFDWGALGWWSFAGVIGALGLLSKQMMLVFPGIVLVHMLLSRTDRRRLCGPGFYVMFGCMVLFAVVPVTLWNAHHEWVMFDHTRHHVEHEPDAFSLFKMFDHVSVYQLTQLGLATPLTYILTVVVMLGVARSWRRLDVGTRYLALFCVPALLVFVVFSFTQSVNPNWPLVFYISVMPILGGWLAGRLDYLKVPRLPGWFGRQSGSRLGRVAATIGAVLALGVAVYAQALPRLGYGGTKADGKLSKMRGWSELGPLVEARLATAPDPARTFVIGLQRKTVSSLAFYMPSRPMAYRFTPDPAHLVSQYDVWPNPLQDGRLGWDALIAVEADSALPSALVACFASVEPLGEVKARQGDTRTRDYTLWLGRRLESWPVAATPPVPGDAADE